MRGILLAAGKGTRLAPMTEYISKHLLPIYDKPIIHYSLSVLLLAGIREILVICNERDLVHYQRLFGSGKHYGLDISYEVQEHANGIAESLIIAEDFIGEHNVCLVLGDNFFFGQGFAKQLVEARQSLRGAAVFGVQVSEPSTFGVAVVDENDNVLEIVEKPTNYVSNLAVPGVYMYDRHATNYAKSLTPSMRGELEITDLNNLYVKRAQLRLQRLGRGVAWLDTGTPDNLLKASTFVQLIQTEQNTRIADLKEIASKNGWI